MIPNLWQLQYDPFPLTTAAARWVSVADQVSATADRVLAAVHRVLGDGWDSAAADAFDANQRQLIGGLDEMAVVARDIADTLQSIAGDLEATQQRLDQDWAAVKMVPHQFVGPEKILLFWPQDGEEEKVNKGLTSARTLRGDLDATLYDKASRLAAAQSTFESSRASFMDAARASTSAPEPVNVNLNISLGPEGPAASTGVAGRAEGPAPVATPGLGTIGPVSFNAPPVSANLSGALSGGIVPPAALAEAMRKAGGGPGGMPMGAGGMPVRGGGAGGMNAGQSRRRAGVAVIKQGAAAKAGAAAKRTAQVVPKPRVTESVAEGPEVRGEKPERAPVKAKIDNKVWLGGEGEEERLARAQKDAIAARDKADAAEEAERDAEKEAKRAEIEERREARAARRAARIAEAAAAG